MSVNADVVSMNVTFGGAQIKFTCQLSPTSKKYESQAAINEVYGNMVSAASNAFSRTKRESTPQDYAESIVKCFESAEENQGFSEPMKEGGKFIKQEDGSVVYESRSITPAAYKIVSKAIAIHVPN